MNVQFHERTEGEATGEMRGGKCVCRCQVSIGIIWGASQASPVGGGCCSLPQALLPHGQGVFYLGVVASGLTYFPSGTYSSIRKKGTEEEGVL